MPGRAAAAQDSPQASAPLEKLWHKLLHNPIAPMVGETLYAIGFSAEYAVVRTGRRLQHGLRRLLQTVRELLKNIAFMAFPGRRSCCGICSAR